LSYDSITKTHQRKLKVRTKEGEGSEFIIDLPVSGQFLKLIFAFPFTGLNNKDHEKSLLLFSFLTDADLRPRKADTRN
jgi:hypothetical protein